MIGEQNGSRPPLGLTQGPRPLSTSESGPLARPGGPHPRSFQAPSHRSLRTGRARPSTVIAIPCLASALTAGASQPRNLVESWLEIRARGCGPLGRLVVVRPRIADELLDPPHCRPLAYRSNVGSREALGAPGQLGEQNVIVQRDLGRVNLTHLLPPGIVQLLEFDDESESTGADTRRVNEIQAVGRAEDNHITQLRQSIQLVEELADDPVRVAAFEPHY